MTQFLVEEAAFLALEVEETQRVEAAAEGRAQHDRLRAMAERQVSRGVL